MDRRTFILLTGTASGAIIRPLPSHRSARPHGNDPGSDLGLLRFELDERQRWSLWYRGDGPPVPLVRAATLGVWIGGQLVTLADLEYSTVGNRRPPGGASIVVRGHAAGVIVEAELFAASAAAAPQAAVSVAVYPDRELPTVRGVRFLQAPAAEVMPGRDDLVALVNGYESRSACRVVSLPADVTSYGAVGLTRGGRGLALAFESAEPGDGIVRVTADGLEAASDWAPARPLRPGGDTTQMRLSYVPDGDGLDALRALFVPASPVDQERLASSAAPAGWCSGSELRGAVTEADLIANLEFCAARFDRRFCRFIELDDGYQRAMGDWLPGDDRFPHGHRWLTDQIHAKGLQAGLWLAPFGVAEHSGVATAHPEWLLKGPDDTTPVVCETREEWGGRVYALDSAHPAARQWLFDLARRAVQEWGYDYLKLDLLLWATQGDSHYGGLTHAEAIRSGLGALRDGAGTEAFLVGGGAPLQHPAGLVNALGIGPDADASWSGLQGPARATALRSFYHRGAWLNLPGQLVVRPPLSPAEARLWTSIVAVSGGLAALSDNLPNLPADRIELLERAMPVATGAGRPVGAMRDEPEVAPALVADDEPHRITSPWRFRTGDDPAYAARGYDETAWEAVAVPGSWQSGGHSGYSGCAWYRVRFTLPNTPPGRSGGRADGRTVTLELGKIDDADETFVNGVKVGQTGDFPPHHVGAREAFRRYALPSDALNWGGENVVAIRTYGSGGLWSVRRERPAGNWIIEGTPGWWTVVLANWEDQATQITLPLFALGLGAGGKRYNAYDVWRDAPVADVTDAITAKLDAHAALTIALRAAVARPQVIGTSRHVVQGAVDIADETWDATTRTLKARSVNRDTRAYTVTIAVPKGMRPAACKADPACTVKRLESGHAVLAWPAGDARDVAWEARFAAEAARGGKRR